MRALGAFGLLGGLVLGVQAAPRVLAPDDYLKFADVSAPRVSPDGAYVAYVVGTADRAYRGGFKRRADYALHTGSLRLARARGHQFGGAALVTHLAQFF